MNDSTYSLLGSRGVIFPFVAALLGIGLWSGCDNFLSGLDEETGSATLNVLLTDAPFPYDLVDAANVTITEVQLVPASTDEENDGSDEETTDNESEETANKTTVASDEPSDEEGNGIITLKTTWGESGDESISFNLLELQNGITAELVGDAGIPAGTYSQIRLIVAEEATLVDTEGMTHNLKIPSGTQTGVKIQLDSLELTDGSITTAVLDFNLEDSFVARGNIDRPEDLQGMLFKPVVHLESVTEGAPEEETEETGENGEEDSDSNDEETSEE